MELTESDVATLKRAARMSMGVYPAAVGDVKRTVWQDGWNAFKIRKEDADRAEDPEYQAGYMACIAETNKQEASVLEWFHALPEEKATIILELIRKSYLWVFDEEQEDGSSQWSLELNCNDLFYWACADSETVPIDEVLSLKESIDKYPGNYGADIWACKKRGQLPQEPVLNRMTEAGIDIKAILAK